jgi:hypothetical protein
MLRIITQTPPEDWDENLPTVEFAVNNAVTSTGYTPFELDTGMHPLDPRTVWLGDLVWQDKNLNQETILQEWSAKLNKAHTIYSEGLKQAAEDASKFRRKPDFKVGDFVMLKTKYLNWPGVDLLGKHLKPPNAGPFKVIAMDDRNVTIDWNKPGVKIHPVQPINRVFRHVADTSTYRISKSRYRQPPPVLTPDGEVFEIDKILNRRLRNYGRGQRYEYLVSWIGYNEFYNQWTPEVELLRGAKASVDDYNRLNPK